MHAPAPAPRRTQRRHDHGDRLRVRRARHDSRGAHHLPSGEPGEGAAPRFAGATGGRQERGGLPGRAGGRDAAPRAAVTGGDTAAATQVVEPGSYVLVCWIPSLDGTPHVMKGMLHPLVVTASRAPVAPAPAADVTITLTDYDFLLSHPLTAGHHVVRVDNAGAQGHEVVIAALAPGKTLHDFIAWEQGGRRARCRRDNGSAASPRSTPVGIPSSRRRSRRGAISCCASGPMPRTASRTSCMGWGRRSG